MMQPPTIDSIDKNGGTPIISGTFDPAFTKIIQVTFGGRTYVQGIDSEIVVTNSRWKLDLSKLWPPLEAGSYEIIVEAVGYDGTTLEARHSVSFSETDIKPGDGAGPADATNRPRPSHSLGPTFFMSILCLVLMLFILLLLWRRRRRRVEEDEVYYMP